MIKKDFLKKTLALTMCGVLSVSVLAGCGNSDSDDEKETTTQAESEAQTSNTAEGEGYGDKDETVYVTTDATGTVSKITVSDWLKNTKGVKTLKDKTTLSDVINVMGDEKFTLTDGELAWDTTGKDIYYQGTLDASTTIPVSLKVTYFLDGTEISAKDLTGKSGALKMVINYTNNQIATVGDSKLYVPFLAVTGVLLPEENFSNVTVDNGTVLSNGNYNVVAGYALPGINENLGLKDDKAIIPDTVTINADVKDCNIAMMMTMVTNSIMDKISFDDSKINGEAQDMIKQLSDAVAQLSTGADSLSAGIQTLQAGASQLSTGITSADNGAKQLSAGISELATKLTGMYTTISQTIADNKAKMAQLQGALAKLDKTSPQYMATATQYSAQLNQLGGANAALQQILDTMNAAKLTDNLTLLVQGAQNLATGLDTANAKTPELLAGIDKLLAGAKQLSTGMNTFNESAVNKLVSIYQGDIQALMNSAKAMVGTAQNYKSFTAAGDNVNSSVKFIIKTDFE